MLTRQGTLRYLIYISFALNCITTAITLFWKVFTLERGASWNCFSFSVFFFFFLFLGIELNCCHSSVLWATQAAVTQTRVFCMTRRARLSQTQQTSWTTTSVGHQEDTPMPCDVYLGVVSAWGGWSDAFIDFQGCNNAELPIFLPVCCFKHLPLGFLASRWSN